MLNGIKLITHPSLENGFFLKEEEIDKRITKNFKDLSESLEMRICAIWVEEHTIEIYLIEHDPDDESLATLERISESFLGDRTQE